MTGTALTSTTWRTLRRLLRALLVGTAVTVAGCLAVFLGVHRAADAVATQSVPSILAVHDTQVALRAAHGAALDGFSDGTRLLGGPGEEYQNQIASAGQHLARVAEANAAGAEGSRDIQVVEALLVTYTGLVSRADVGLRDDPANPVGTAALWDAASLLTEILVRLDRLREAQVAAFDEQTNRVWTRPVTALVWLLPVLVLAGLLVVAQTYLRRRFRRRLNAPLLLATFFVVVMGAATASSLWSADRLADVRSEIATVERARSAHLTTLAALDAGRLAGQLTAACEPLGGCRHTVDRVAPDGVPSGRESEQVTDARRATAAELDRTARLGGQDATDRATAAATSFAGEFLIPVAALCVAVTVLLGFQPRLDEYRYHER
ncbi:hypothetical protein [Micromonospora cathayae]|uniref:Integral membrane protein n=1 Tax=Micromonospora cathayae TaxID=3028804 RepID=A0ABY7ZWA5_9ACTN|nr:hypothetical protein [Micromonospora sp. HUAS 3]WDZ87106.1 hypothetical protein PVK37_12200 [Micromonospora sp. HUAS 3]